jgi:Ca2+-binding EF-hand superfamily protein
MDANGDGFADKDELMQMIQRQPQQESRQGILSRLLEQDANGDGKISVEEAPDAVRQRFERMDANGDGFLDQREIQAMMSGRGRQQR